VEFVAGQQAEAERQAVAYQSELKTAKQQLDASQAELTTKEDQLGVMEGEFAALKEVLGEAGGQRDVVASLLTKISALQTAVAAAEATRRKLHNELVCIRGNIRVYCRVKPHPASVVRCAPDQSGVAIAVDGKEHTFAYDRVFTPGTAQEDVFASVSELVQSALDGYHVCLFSYGQTGAGKTYTMQGTDSPAGRGIIPRAVEKILDTAAQLQEQCEWEYSMEASFVEVYNNSLRDLLGGPSSPYINDQSAIKHDAAGGHTTVTGVSKVPISDAGAADALIRRAAASRACEATAMNAE
ncbi:kinesin motor domain-containing protein, partial [Haematococcus lacustris]